MYIQRQIQAFLATGDAPAIAEATTFPWRQRDVRPSLVLVLAAGKQDSDAIRLNAGQSYALPLPSDYDTTRPLFCALKASSAAKVVTVSPAHATSTALIKAASGYPGILQWTGRVTSITVSNPHATDATLVEYFLHELPDLTLAASFRGGFMAFGYVTP